MKANAPEKLYIDLFKGEFNVSCSPINDSVEYTRTDAFIEKACLFLVKHSNFISFSDMFIKDFENYMKGE